MTQQNMKVPRPPKAPQPPKKKQQPNAAPADNGFVPLGLSQEIIRVLEKREITQPTDIQQNAIPVAAKGDDVVGIAQTGTGKTLAFVLPLIHRQEQGNVALILAPTRELAMQVEEVCRWFRDVKTALVIGGASKGKQLDQIRRRPNVIIATPGRLIDFLEGGQIDLKRVDRVVMDEADRMFDMGFLPQIEKVLAAIPRANDPQVLLFSATMPAAIGRLIQDMMHQPVHIEVASSGETAKDVTQEMIVVDKAHKKQALFEVLEELQGAAIIFSRTKHGAKKLTRDLRNAGYRAEELHGNLSQSQRKRSMDAIQKKKSRFLVATDIAARGIDIAHLNTVINYDLPDNPEDYVHRIGRTGRAGRTGKAISLVASDQGLLLRDIHRLIDVQLEQVHLDDVPSAQITNAPKKKGGRGGYRGGGGGRGHRGRSNNQRRRSGGSNHRGSQQRKSSGGRSRSSRS